MELRNAPLVYTTSKVCEIMGIKILIYLFAGVSLGKCLEEKIVGGSIAYSGQFPYQASLRIRNNHFCGASILDETTILTAAHCFLRNTKTTTYEINVIVGTNSVGEGGHTYKTKKLLIHENYYIDYNNETGLQAIYNDIALLKLSEKIKFTNLVKPIQLDKNFAPGGLQGIASGWGITYPTHETPSSVLKYVQEQTLSDQECVQKYPMTTKYNNGLCAISENGSVCKGDSGGPFVVNNKQVGISSFVRGCFYRSLNVFTRVSAYISWIEDNKRK